uniref:Wall-associated receptor kinase 4-like n=1 Tax=Elaeis guineensis var. tenera TaxID=51953 RepID=A0A6I9QJK3_ELAGV|nr:wall-associated receptor kinase 4-like [Elaeis guineensis]
MATAFSSFSTSFILFFFFLYFLIYDVDAAATLRFTFHHSFSNQVCRWVECRAKNLPDRWLEKGTIEYYAILAGHDRGHTLFGAILALTFFDGNATLQISLLGFIEKLEKATNDFNERQILDRGGYGTVYKDILPSQDVAAIKKSKLVDENQIEQWINEIIILSHITRRNVARLLGYRLEIQVSLLVYEFISNGTLFHHIHSQSHDFLMPLEVHLKIAAETARVLAYLNSTALVSIIYKDIKSTNILLDDIYTDKVLDSGASMSVPFDQVDTLRRQADNIV